MKAALTFFLLCILFYISSETNFSIHFQTIPSCWSSVSRIQSLRLSNLTSANLISTAHQHRPRTRYRECVLYLTGSLESLLQYILLSIHRCAFCISCLPVYRHLPYCLHYLLPLHVNIPATAILCIQRMTICCHAISHLNLSHIAFCSSFYPAFV